MAALQALGVALSSATTEEDVGRAVAEHVVDALTEGGGSVVARVRGDVVDLIGARGLYAEAMERWRSFPLAARVPAADVIRTREPLWMGTREAYFERYPEPLDAAPESLVQALAAVPLMLGHECLGALALSFRRGRPFEDAERDAILTFARMCAQGLDRVRQHAAARREAARLSVLVEAARLVAENEGGFAASVGRVARKFAEVVGDSCSVWLVSDDGRYADPIALEYRDPEVTRLAREVFERRRWPARESPVAWVREQGGALRMEGEVIAMRMREAPVAYRPLGERWAPHAIAVVPLTVRGHVVGALLMSRADERRGYDDEELTLLSAGAHHASLALGAERARARTALLADVAGALVESVEVDHVVRSLAERVVPQLADGLHVDLLDDEGALRQALVHHVDAERGASVAHARERFGHLTGQRLPSLHAAHGHRATRLRLDDATQLRIASSSEHLEAIRATRVRSAIVAPLVARDRLAGVITLCRTDEQVEFDDDDLAFCEDLAARAALVLDNLRLLAETRAAVRLRERFLSIASHELKTPAATVILQLEALRKALRGAGAEEAAGPWPERIEALTRRLTRLVDDLLDVSAIGAGRMRLAPEELDLRELVDDAVARMAEDARAPIRVSGDPTLCGRWDRARIDQIVTNLLTNARKYGAGAPIDVALRREGGVAYLSVRDHGPGIAGADRARIFEPFERGAHAERGGGLGLGLFIVKSLAEAHAGSVRVEGEEGSGATFVVGLPITRSTP
jgi:signal transduction histidine kinase